jgi:hypothetical protein
MTDAGRATSSKKRLVEYGNALGVPLNPGLICDTEWPKMSQWDSLLPGLGVELNDV